LPFQNIDQCVYACIVACAIHNFCIFEKEESFEVDFQGNDDDLPENVNMATLSARSFRDKVVHDLYNHL
jgi:hypothetical protein